MPPVVFHVGFPKTATTMLQRVVFATHPGIANVGKPYETAGEPTPLARALRNIAYDDTIAFEARGGDAVVVRRAIEAGLASGRPVMLSDENFSTNRNKDRGVVAARLHAIWPEARILFTVREQRAFLVSHYLHDVRRGASFEHSGSFARWLAEERRRGPRGIWALARYEDLIVYYARLFGAGRIRVLLFEDMARDRPAFAAGLGSALELPAAPFEAALAGAPRVKERINRSRLLFHRLNWLAAPAGLRRLLEPAGGPFRRLLALDPAKARVGVPAPLAEPLRADFAEGNRRLEAQFGLSLARYGYAL